VQLAVEWLFNKPISPKNQDSTKERSQQRHIKDGRGSEEGELAFAQKKKRLWI